MDLPSAAAMVADESRVRLYQSDDDGWEWEGSGELDGNAAGTRDQVEIGRLQPDSGGKCLIRFGSLKHESRISKSEMRNSNVPK